MAATGARSAGDVTPAGQSSPTRSHRTVELASLGGLALVAAVGGVLAVSQRERAGELARSVRTHVQSLRRDLHGYAEEE